MQIPTWRLLLTGGAVVTLGVAGIGLVAAASAPATSPEGVVSSLATAGPEDTAASTGTLGRDRLGDRGATGTRLLRLGRRVVHVEATITDRDGKLITIWLDHGTVQIVGSGSLTVAETGGGTQTVKVDDQTIVRMGRDAGSLADVKTGLDVFVQSRVVDGGPLAKRIVIIPTKTAT